MTDNWFTCNNDLVIDIVGLGLKYLGMDKNFSQKYLYNGCRISEGLCSGQTGVA